MAFTHYSPQADRHYATAYSYSTSPPTSFSFGANSQSRTDTLGTTYYTRETTYDSNVGTSYSNITSTNKSKQTQNTFFNGNSSSSFTESGSSARSSNYSAYGETQTSSYLAAEGETRNDTFNDSGQTEGGGTTRTRHFTEEQINNNYEGGQTYSSVATESFTITRSEASANTGGGVSVTSYTEDGSTLSQVNETSGDSTYTSTKSFIVSRPEDSPAPTITGTSITGSYAINTSGVTIATELGTSSQAWFLDFSTETSMTSLSYSSLSSNQLETVSSSYEVKTTILNNEIFWDSTSTYDCYLTTRETITERSGDTYRISTIYGGAGFISGGVTLDNNVVTGATTTSIYSVSISQPTIFNSYSYQNYLQPTTGQINVDTISFSTGDITAGGFVGTSVTILTTSTVDIEDTLDFGRSSISAKVFSSYTTDSFIRGVRTGNGLYLTQKTSSRAGHKPTTFSGYSTLSADITTGYFSDGEWTSAQKLTTVYADGTWNTLVPAGAGDTGTRSDSDTHKVTAWSVQPEKYRAGYFITSYPYMGIITYDKGPQGGIQNEKSSDVSGAVRDSRPITIADQVITSTTYDSPAATINITGNTAESNSYTSSAGLALGLELKLNRYLTYLPHERYGDIVSSIDSMQYSYSDDGIGSSFVRFTSTGIYSTTKTGSAGSSLNTQSFSSELLGKAKIGLGAVYSNGQIIEPRIGGGIFGGQKFTDKEGAFSYPSLFPPLTITAFGSNSSSLISIDSIESSNSSPYRSSTLPADSVIFNKARSTFVAVTAPQFFFTNYITIDRKQ